MSPKRMPIIIAALIAACIVPVTAQQKLGDMVAEGGYDWIIGRWAAETDNGGKVEVKYEWTVDKHAVLSDISLEGFRYRGLVMLSPVSGEVLEAGVDNRGGTWKGIWSPDAAGLVQKTEQTGADGQVHKIELVYDKTGADSVTIAFYGTDGNGNRGTEPMGKLTYKRQAAATAAAESAAGGQGSQSRDYQTLGDMVSAGGYTWLLGKWLASDESRSYEVEYKPILDQHAALADVKIGDFKYMGLIMFASTRQEVFDIGVDNMGGIYKGTWEQDGEGVLNRLEYTGSDGTVRKMQHVYSKVSAGGFKVAEYAVEAGGARASTPRRELTFKPQKAAAESK
jgi:hypothetical protein